MRRKPGRAGLVAVAVLTLAVTGCGRSDDPRDVATAATAGTRPTVTATTATGLAAYVEAQRRWVGCLREQGFQVPDPDAKGRVDLRFPGAPKKGDPQWTQAQMACAKYNVPIPDDLEEKPILSPQEIAHRRDYARCMQENGVPEFADPTADGSFPGLPATELTEQQAAAQFRASQICAPVLDGRPRTTPNPNATAQG